jgi:hypothetical protein
MGKVYNTIADMLRDDVAGGYYTQNNRYSSLYAYRRIHRMIQRREIKVEGNKDGKRENKEDNY